MYNYVRCGLRVFFFFSLQYPIISASFFEKYFPFLLNNLALLSKIKPAHLPDLCLNQFACLPAFLSGNLIFESEPNTVL